MPTPTATLFLPYSAFDATGAAWAGFATIYDAEPWTPALTGTGGASGQTYALQQGRATRIGRLVWATLDLVLTAKGTITGSVLVTGLPAALTPARNSGAVLRFVNLATNWSQVIASVASGQTVLTLAGNAGPSSSSNATPLTASDLTNTTELRGIVQYEV